MNWTENKPPMEGKSLCNHTILKIPIGEFIIEWKDWKEKPDYDVILNGEYIRTGYDLPGAKDIVKNHLIQLANKLNGF